MRLYAEGDGWASDNPLLGYNDYPNMTASPMQLEFEVLTTQAVSVGLEMLGWWPYTDNAWWIRPDPSLVRIGEACCQGDADHSGFVNGSDFVSVRDHYGESNPPGGLGDSNCDSFVNVDDYRSVRDHFGMSCD
jgi:hypothetical protein